MRRLGLWLLTLGLAGLIGCGGRSVEDPGSGGSETDPPPADTATGSPGKAGSMSSLPKHDLGNCTPGFNRAEDPDRACHWLTEAGQCFKDVNDACACICPADRDSVCFSAFDGGPYSATRVYCE